MLLLSPNWKHYKCNIDLFSFEDGLRHCTISVENLTLRFVLVLFLIASFKKESENDLGPFLIELNTHLSPPTMILIHDFHLSNRYYIIIIFYAAYGGFYLQEMVHLN